MITAFQWLRNALFFCGAYSPLALFFCARDYNWEQGKFENPFSVLLALAIADLCALGTIGAARLVHCENPITIRRISLRSNDLVNYSLPYVSTFFGIKFTDGNDLSSLLIFMGLLFWLTEKTQAIFINPILALIGFGLYEIEYEDSGGIKNSVALARCEITINKDYHARKLSSFLLMIDKVDRGQDGLPSDFKETEEDKFI